MKHKLSLHGFIPNRYDLLKVLNKITLDKFKDKTLN